MIHPDLAGARTLIFDMDGTLISSGKIAKHSLRKGLSKFYQSIGEPVPEYTEEELLSGIGAPSEVFFRDLLDARNKHRWEEFRAVILEQEKEHLAKERITFPGAINTLETLVKRGYQLALVSNCGSEYLQAILDTQNLRKYFVKAICIGDRDGSTKTELVAEVAAELGGKTALIGDRGYDVDAGTANGLPVVGALYGYGSREELSGTATWVEDIRHLLFIFNPLRELAARIAAEANRLRPIDRPFVVALESPHAGLSFPLSQHLLNELADLNIPAAHFHLENYLQNGSSLNGTDWIASSYPWATVDDLLEQRMSGKIDVQLPQNGTQPGRPLRARAGAVVLIEGDFLSGNWVENSFDYHVKLEADSSTISRILKSDKSIDRQSKLVGALKIPAEFVNPSNQLDEWTSSRASIREAYLSNGRLTNDSIPGMTINGNALEIGKILNQS
jgi:phosphoglycolate phosphatase